MKTLITLEAYQEALNKMENLVMEVAQAIVQEDIENSQVLITSILEEVGELVETMKVVEENLDDEFEW